MVNRFNRSEIEKHSPKSRTSALGRLGEDIACEYLIDKGYKIIERNFRRPWGELDIIARAPDKTLVFVEVKTMSQNEGGIQPEDQVTKAKLRKTQKAASLYAGHYPEKISGEKGWRIDLIAIAIKDTHDLTDYKKDCDIRYYENI